MLQRQEEVADVDVVLKRNFPGGNSAAIAQLRSHGLQINGVDDADGVVEGTIPADRLNELQRLSCVADLRDVFTYLAAETQQSDEGHRIPGGESSIG